jgi:tRNA (guanine37-N1)-methyltransferase
MKKIDIITIFPESVTSYLNTSLIKKAREKKLIQINPIDLRDFTQDPHRTTDDSPYGGGPGMVLKIEPIYKATQELCRPERAKRVEGPRKNSTKSKSKTRIILFSTRGTKLDQKAVRRLAKYDHLILICGRYEGVDERVAKKVADEEISIGDYVLSGGELPALVLTEAVSRHIPGVLGKKESLEEIKGSYPVYTRPEVFETKEGKKLRVPKVLLSGNHKKIEEWRKKF